jgi:hypothetical protein
VYELTIDVDQCTSNDEVIVRAWIDYLQNAELTTEVELALSKDGANKWTANFSVPEASDDDAFAYRVGLVAQPGASWSLRIRECSAGDTTRTLLEDGDVLTTRKEWLLGTCDVQR